MANKNIIMAVLGVLIIVVVLAAASVFFSSKPSSTSSVGPTAVTASSNANISTSVLLTDPPTVPNGTSALVLQYSSIGIHSAANGWISSNTEGSVNLMSLTNISLVAASLNLPANTTPDIVKFYISNASITINGQKYNVTIPGSQITAHLSSASAISNTSSILVQLSPVVVTIYTNTTPDFILVPSAKAVVVGNISYRAKPKAGEFIPLSDMENKSLEKASPNITITNASLLQDNGTTRISLTVKDNSNFSVRLMHVGIQGIENVSVNTTKTSEEANIIVGRAEKIITEIENETTNASSGMPEVRAVQNRSDSSNYTSNGSGGESSGVSIHAHLNATSSSGGANSSTNTSANGKIIIPVTNNRISDVIAGAENYPLFNASVNFHAKSFFQQGMEISNLSGDPFIGSFVTNALTNGTVNTTLFRTGLSNMVRQSMLAHSDANENFQNRNRVLNFQIESNGSLQLPFSEDQFNNGNLGYNLSPGQSATFVFSGSISLANGKMQISLVPGATYGVIVRGNLGAAANANLTAAK